MRQWIRRGVNVLLLLVSVNVIPILLLSRDNTSVIGRGIVVYIAALAVFFVLNCSSPQKKRESTKRIQMLATGTEFLRLFLITVTLSVFIQLFCRAEIREEILAGEYGVDNLVLAMICGFGILHMLF